MHKFALSITALALGVALAGQAQAQADARQQLLEQVRLGESAKRDDLVRQSLYRLELISPDDPDVIAARMRYLLRQGDNTGAQEQFARLANSRRSRPLISRRGSRLRSPRRKDASNYSRRVCSAPPDILRRRWRRIRNSLTARRLTAIWLSNTGRWWRKIRHVATRLSARCRR